MNDADNKQCVYWQVKHIDDSPVVLGLVHDCSIQFIKNDNTEEQSPIRPTTTCC